MKLKVKVILVCNVEMKFLNLANLRSCGRRVGECGACERGFDEHDVCGGDDCEGVHGEGDVDAANKKKNQLALTEFRLGRLQVFGVL